MTLEQIIKLNNEIITLEQLAEIEESQCVELVEDNGMSGLNGKHWYSITVTEMFINDSCDDVTEIQVYV